MSTESKGPFHVGEDVELVATTGAAVGTGALFEIRVRESDGFERLIDEIPTKVEAGASPGGPQTAKATWKVSLKSKDDRLAALPATIVVTVFVPGGGTKLADTFVVEPDAGLGNARWRRDGSDELLVDPRVHAGDKMRLEVDVADESGRAIVGDFEVRFDFELVDEKGAAQSTPKTLKKTVTDPGGGTKTIEAKWTVEAFSKPPPVRVQVRASWNRRPHETAAPADLAAAVSPALTVHPDPIRVKVADPDDVNALGKESAQRKRNGGELDPPFAHTLVAIVGDASKMTVDELANAGQPADEKGEAVVEFPLSADGQAVVLREAPGAVPLRWTNVSGGTVKSGATNEVKIGGRVRLSTWAHSSIMNRPDMLSAMAGTAGLDDVSILQTLWPREDSSVTGGLGVEYAPNFEAASNSARDGLIKGTLGALQPKVQVSLGYEIVTQDPDTVSDPAVKKLLVAAGERGTQFVKWINKADDAAIDAHAKAIVEFFEKKGMAIDGVNFDLEVNGLGGAPPGTPDPQKKKIREETRRKMGRLYGQVAEQCIRAFGRHSVVSYATGGFTQDGVISHSFMAVQPFALCHDGPNLIARPMAYDDGPEDSPDATLDPATSPLVKKHARIVACALGNGPTDAGLHPAQFQLGVKITKAGISGLITKKGVEVRCEHLCRPNRIGIVTFGATRIGDVDAFASYETKANGGFPPRGTPGQPIQVPTPEPKK